MKKTGFIIFFLAGITINVFSQTFEDGIKALDYENFSTAKAIFSKLVKQQPLESKNYYYLGLSYSIATNIDSARIVFNQGINADSKAISNYIGLGRTYLDQNNSQKALEYFDKAKSLTNQKDVNLYLYMADAYSASQYPNFDMAITMLNKAIEITNKNPEVYWVLGRTYELMINKSGDAVSSFERSTELNPTYAKSFTRIGVIWRKAQNYNLSLSSFQSALKADADFPPAYREMAELYYYTGQYQKAEETYQKYLTMADKGDVTQFRYAQFLFLTKKYQDALNILNTLKPKSDAAILSRLLGYSNYEIGDYKQSLIEMNEFFQKAAPEKIIASDYEYLGKAQLKTGNDSLGILNINKAISIDSNKFDLYNDIAKYYYDNKKYEMAGNNYKLKISSSKKGAALVDYFNAGRSFYFAGKYDRADSAFIKVISLNPAWPIGYLWRAMIMSAKDSQIADSVKGLAAPYYLMVIDKSYLSDTMKYQKELFSAFKYMGDINALRENYGASLYYYSKAMAINSTDPDVKATIDAVKKNYKGVAGSSVSATKAADGFMLPITINGNLMSVLYSPGITGIGTTQEGHMQLFGSSTNALADLRVGDRSTKGVSTSIISDMKQPIGIGADVLNKMNIVFDYPSSSLLQR